MSKTNIKQNQVVHQLNSVLLVINHTYDGIEENRNGLNELTKFVNLTVTSVNRLVMRMEVEQVKWSQLTAVVHAERSIQIMEQCYHEFLHLKHKYVLQRSSLEAGRLNEFLLTTEQLENALLQEPQGEIVAIQS